MVSQLLQCITTICCLHLTTEDYYANLYIIKKLLKNFNNKQLIVITCQFVNIAIKKI